MSSLNDNDRWKVQGLRRDWLDFPTDVGIGELEQ